MIHPGLNCWNVWTLGAQEFDFRIITLPWSCFLSTTVADHLGIHKLWNGQVTSPTKWKKKGGRFQTSSKQLTFCFQRIDFGQRIDSVSTHPLTPFGVPPLKTVAPLGHTPAEYDLRTVLVAASPWLLMMSDFFVGFYVYTHIYIVIYSYIYIHTHIHIHIHVYTHTLYLFC